MKMMKPFLLPPLPSSALSFQEPCGSSPQWCKVKIVQSVRLFEWPQNLSIGLCCVRRDIVLLGDSRVSRRSPLGQTSRLTRTWTCSKKRMFPHFEDLEISTVSLSEPFFSSLKKKKKPQQNRWSWWREYGLRGKFGSKFSQFIFPCNETWLKRAWVLKGLFVPLVCALIITSLSQLLAPIGN